MLYFPFTLFSLYHLILKIVNICYYIDNCRNDYSFEQSSNYESNIELNDDYFDNYLLSDNVNHYYYAHLDYMFFNKIDEKLTKYFNIN